MILKKMNSEKNLLKNSNFAEFEPNSKNSVYIGNFLGQPAVIKESSKLEKEVAVNTFLNNISLLNLPKILNVSSEKIYFELIPEVSYLIFEEDLILELVKFHNSQKEILIPECFKKYVSLDFSQSKVLSRINRHKLILEDIIDTAVLYDFIAKSPRNYGIDKLLCHDDFSKKNVLISWGKTFIIDWESSHFDYLSSDLSRILISSEVSKIPFLIDLYFDNSIYDLGNRLEFKNMVLADMVYKYTTAAIAVKQNCMNLSLRNNYINIIGEKFRWILY